ncbi:hypothetical protein [Myxococcus xanthus]|uniref:Uncharacterized protein n=1 Tax=Myxococcus xanthus TaxID=34 RepID=A0A7Y4IMI4_MYXXA|nr:hypothetical protein [Myxococcus xanthus]NOJ81590.1 hypothetical protein [Myxococcus xanthus]NOJ89054.1 hypothetical protein [Myxococcus xanthus]
MRVFLRALHLRLRRPRRVLTHPHFPEGFGEDVHYGFAAKARQLDLSLRS